MFINENLEPISPTGWTYQGVQYPPRIFKQWTDQQLTSVGVYRVVYEELSVPEGKYISGYTYNIEGNVAIAVPVLEDIPETVPERVSKAQGKAALIIAGIWPDVEDYLATLQGEEKIIADLALNDTTEWKRASPFLNQAATALGISDKQLDTLFLQASRIVI